jgi:hypothetical protein
VQGVDGKTERKAPRGRLDMFGRMILKLSYGNGSDSSGSG